MCCLISTDVHMWKDAGSNLDLKGVSIRWRCQVAASTLTSVVLYEWQRAVIHHTVLLVTVIEVRKDRGLNGASTTVFARNAGGGSEETALSRSSTKGLIMKSIFTPVST